MYDLRVDLYDLRMLFHEKAVLLQAILYNTIRTMKRNLLICSLLLAAWMNVAAVEQNVVAIYQLDGQKALFAFADQPEVTYSATDLILTSTKTAVQYPISQLKKIQFETAELPEGIDEVVADKRFSFRDGSIVIEGGEPNSLVNIYTVLGTLTAQYRLDGNGNAIISTQGLSGTVYILSNGSITFKFAQQ